MKRNWRRKVLAGLLLGTSLLSCLLLGGCIDAREVDDLAFVLSLGIDQGKERAYEYTFQLPHLTSETEIGQSSRFHSLTVEAHSLAGAMAIVDAMSAYQLDLSQLNFLVFGKEVAMEGVEEQVRTLMGELMANQTAMVLVSENGASKFLNAMEDDVESSLERLQNSIIDTAKRNGLLAYCTLNMLYEQLDEPGEGVFVAWAAGKEEKKEEESKGGESSQQGGARPSPRRKAEGRSSPKGRERRKRRNSPHPLPPPTRTACRRGEARRQDWW